MKRFMSKKFAAAGLAAVLLVGGGVAFAVITLTGSGTGAGGTTAGTHGSANVTLSVHIASTPTLVPGVTVPVDFDATNLNPDPVTITTISFVSVTSTNALCQSLLSNYPQFSLAPEVVNQTVPANTHDYGLIPSGALTWKDLTSPPVDQDACLGQPLTLNVKTP